MDRAAIIGVGMTKIEKNKVRDTFADMAWEAVNKALDDAGMTIDDIDNVITTSSDFWDGRTISCMAVGDASGAAHKNVSCVEGLLRHDQEPLRLLQDDPGYRALEGIAERLEPHHQFRL
jgi:acetyl-CoA acetyltransferase